MFSSFSSSRINGLSLWPFAFFLFLFEAKRQSTVRFSWSVEKMFV